MEPRNGRTLGRDKLPWSLGINAPYTGMGPRHECVLSAIWAPFPLEMNRPFAFMGPGHGLASMGTRDEFGNDGSWVWMRSHGSLVWIAVQ